MGSEVYSLPFVVATEYCYEILSWAIVMEHCHGVSQPTSRAPQAQIVQFPGQHIKPMPLLFETQPHDVIVRLTTQSHHAIILLTAQSHEVSSLMTPYTHAYIHTYIHFSPPPHLRTSTSEKSSLAIMSFVSKKWLSRTSFKIAMSTLFFF